MEHDEKVIASIKFLLTSVRKLSDSFLESEDRVKQGFAGIASDIDELVKRIESMERQVVDLSDRELVRGRANVEPQLAVAEATKEYIVPILNIPTEQIVEIYSTNPVLLEPFSRPCSLSGRTLSGEIEDVELETFAQGSAWAVETKDQGWVLLPRPGSLQRRTQVHSLERLYEIEGAKSLPAILYLLRPAKIEAVVFGRRWQLQEKGLLGVHPDPVRTGVSERIAAIEQRLSVLESRVRG